MAPFGTCISFSSPCEGPWHSGQTCGEQLLTCARKRDNAYQQGTGKDAQGDRCISEQLRTEQPLSVCVWQQWGKKKTYF